MLRVRTFHWVLLLGVASLLHCASARAKGAALLNVTLAQTEAIARLPESKIDLLIAKLIIDRAIDPSQDNAAVLQQVDALTAAVRKRLPPGASNDAKLERLIHSLHTPGPWNDNRAFSYDTSDPFGGNPLNKTLGRYLATRKGNCVSMPILLVAIGQRMGLPITLATAPTHMFAKYRSDRGAWVNVEATAGGYKLDSSYQRELEITPAAVEQGTYLRALTRAESIGAMLESLAQQRSQQGDLDALLAIADVAVRLDKRNVSALLQQHSVHARRLNQIHAEYASPAELTPGEWIRYGQHFSAFNALERRVEELGWKPPSAEMNARYERTIRDLAK